MLHLAAILAIGLYANVIANEVLHPGWYIPFNLGLLAVTLAVARRAGTTWASMGLRRDRASNGLRVGFAIMAGVMIGMAIVLTVPAAREVLHDERFVNSSVGILLYHALLRIPLGTALYEEVLFRGVIFGMLVRRYSPLTAGIWSSLLFGVWHILPVLDFIETNPVGTHFSGPLAASVAVIGTFAAGMAFLWIRLRANSTLASVLVHIGTNSTVIIAAMVVVHLSYWLPPLLNGQRVNVGTRPMSPTVVVGKIRCRLMAPGGGGAFVVVGAWEARHMAKGGSEPAERDSEATSRW